MRYDIVLSGVGGQGVLSVANIIAAGALRQGLFVKQSELHGMAQRGGAVVAHLRLSDTQIASVLIPRAGASMILSMEPLESLRYLQYLSSDGILIAPINPFQNIPDYPEIRDVLSQIRSLEKYMLVDARKLARRAGSALATNMVMVGLASLYLPIQVGKLECSIRERFATKGLKVLNINLEAFRAGRQAEQQPWTSLSSPQSSKLPDLRDGTVS